MTLLIERTDGTAKMYIGVTAIEETEGGIMIASYTDIVILPEESIASLRLSM